MVAARGVQAVLASEGEGTKELGCGLLTGEVA
jgi:hypothetical protein